MAQQVAATGQVVPGSPSVQTSGGGFWGGLNSTLGNAFSYFLTYEAIKQMRNSTGQDLKDREFITELPNGAAVLVDPSKGSATQLGSGTHFTVGGTQIPKVAVYGVGALVGLAVLFKAIKG